MQDAYELRKELLIHLLADKGDGCESCIPEEVVFLKSYEDILDAMSRWNAAIFNFLARFCSKFVMNLICSTCTFKHVVYGYARELLFRILLHGNVYIVLKFCYLPLQRTGKLLVNTYICWDCSLHIIYIPVHCLKTCSDDAFSINKCCFLRMWNQIVWIIVQMHFLQPNAKGIYQERIVWKK